MMPARSAEPEKKMSIVHIIWEDSCHLSGWHKPERVDEFACETETIETVGFLAQETDAAYVVAQSLSFETGNVIKIPKSCVRQMRVVEGVEIEHKPDA